MSRFVRPESVRVLREEEMERYRKASWTALVHDVILLVNETTKHVLPATQRFYLPWDQKTRSYVLDLLPSLVEEAREAGWALTIEKTGEERQLPSWSIPTGPDGKPWDESRFPLMFYIDLKVDELPAV